ncbi:MAG TPA: hypothetical protein DCY51_08320 [Bacteroidetes bacterium]|nr:hypothetical protein [Bacteroidota bacterium]
MDTKGDEDNTVGAGDLLEKVFTATGIKAAVEVVEKVTGKPCNCKKRQAKANNVRIPNIFKKKK